MMWGRMSAMGAGHQQGILPPMYARLFLILLALFSLDAKGANHSGKRSLRDYRRTEIRRRFS